MQLQYHLTPHDDFVLVHIHGLVSLEAWQRVLAELEPVIATSRSDRLLIDLTGLLGWLGVPERREVGAMMAARFTGKKKVALYIQAHKITNVVRDEAQRLGLDLQLFPNEDDARIWVVSR